MRYILAISLALFFAGNTQVKYTIESESKIQLTLNTNLNTVNCKCIENVTFDTQTAIFEEKSNALDFKGTILKLEVENINCRNKSINNDLRKSLLWPKYSHIEFELSSLNALHQMREASLNVPQYFDAKAFVTIAGKRLPQRIKVTALKVSKDKFKVYATQEISMIAYGVVPKSPLKFIKINDKASVNLDLVLKIN